MKLCFSPCPNDTFLFHAFVKGLVPHPFSLDVSLHDIQELNTLALEGKPDVCKISLNTLSKVLDDYCLLPVGTTMGYGNGPKLVGRRPYDLEDLHLSTLSIPGKGTTAFLLYRILLPQAKVERFCTYEKVPAFLKKWSDFGLIIHETRFRIDELNLYEICDLGRTWEDETGLPIPLGCLVAKRSLGQEKIRTLTQALQGSLDYARAHPEQSLPYILEHSQEKDPKIVQSHIQLYVNDETRQISDKGIQAIATLFKRGRQVKVISRKAVHQLDRLFL